MSRTMLITVCGIVMYALGFVVGSAIGAVLWK